MKKIILILALFAILGFQASAQPGYTYIAQRYKWLAGLFTALGLPSGPGPAAFESGQAQRAGSVYYDSSGIDQGLYIFDGATWVAAGGGTTLTEGEGIAITGDSIHLGTRLSGTGSPFSQNRYFNTNRKGLYAVNGTISDLVDPGGISWDFGQEVFSPYQFISRDTVSGNDVDPPTAAVPFSGLYARRQLVYPGPSVFRTQKVFGHTLEMDWLYTDTLSLNTQSGDWNTGVQFKNVFAPQGTNRQGIRASHGTGQNNSIAYAAPAVLAVTQLRNTASNWVKVDGHLSGFNSYIVMGSNAADTLGRYVYYTTGGFVNGLIQKTYDFAPASYSGPPRVDSAYGWFDTSRLKYWHFSGRTVLGPSRGTAHAFTSSDIFKVIGNATITDSLTLGKATQLGSTTGLRIMSRRTSDGAVFEVDPSVISSGSTRGLDDILSINQALTTNRTTPTSAFLWDLNSSSTNRTFGAVNTGTGGVALYGNGSGSLGIGVQSTGVLYSLYGICDNVPIRLDNNRGATSNMLELNRAYNAGTAPDGMVGNIYEYSMENTSGSVTPVHNLQVKLDESSAGNETASVQIAVKHNGAFEDYLDMQTAGIVRTNNNADTLASRAYARSLIAGGGAVWGAIAGTLSDQTDLQAALDAKANTTLNNLGSVAVNTTIASDADNTDDLGTSSNSWKDIYTRTVKYDGSTSGTVTVEAQTNAISPLVTTASGQGYGCSCMEAREAVGSDFTGQNVNTVQPMFNTSIDVWPLQGSTSYDFEGFLSLSHGATSHSVGLSFELSGGASVTSITYITFAWVTAIGTQTASQTTNLVQVATNVNVNAAGANATEQIFFKGTINMNAAGNVTPSYTFSAAPGGTCVTKGGSYIKFCPKGTNTFTNQGPAN